MSDACRIIEDRKIKAGLIGDESRLRKSRTSVCWLSANSWPSPGSLYGVIQFKFSWEDIIRDNKVYWVEAITKYRPSAYRFLITDRDLSNSTLVQSYDPTRAEGPLRLRGEEWYWSGKYTSEFMLDANLPLRRCVEISAIKHRADLCRLHRPRCPEAARSTWSTGAQMLAYVIGRNLRYARHCFVRRTGKGEREPGFGVRDTLGFLLDELLQEEDLDGPVTSRRRSDAVLKGALLLYGLGQFDDAGEVIRTLASREIAKAALERQAREFLGLPEFSLLD